MGVTHSQGAHQDLCDLTSSKLERLVAEKRPKVCDWYSCPKLCPTEAPIIAGYHPPDIRPVCPVPGYTGHVPGKLKKLLKILVFELINRFVFHRTWTANIQPIQRYIDCLYTLLSKIKVKICFIVSFFCA